MLERALSAIAALVLSAACGGEVSRSYEPPADGGSASLAGGDSGGASGMSGMSGMSGSGGTQAGGCCNVAGDCPFGDECVSGTCVAALEADECWSFADCFEGVCEEPFICNCGSSCSSPSVPGWCRPTMR
jgi:hypothetical protein